MRRRISRWRVRVMEVVGGISRPCAPKSTIKRAIPVGAKLFFLKKKKPALEFEPTTWRPNHSASDRCVKELLSTSVHRAIHILRTAQSEATDALWHRLPLRSTCSPTSLPVPQASPRATKGAPDGHGRRGIRNGPLRPQHDVQPQWPLLPRPTTTSTGPRASN